MPPNDDDSVILSIEMKMEDHAAISDIAISKDRPIAYIALQAIRQYIDQTETAEHAEADVGKNVRYW